MRIRCPGCQVILEAPDTRAGRRTACPRCRKPFLLPSPGLVVSPPRVAAQQPAPVSPAAAAKGPAPARSGSKVLLGLFGALLVFGLVGAGALYLVLTQPWSKLFESPVALAPVGARPVETSSAGRPLLPEPSAGEAPKTLDTPAPSPADQPRNVRAEPPEPGPDADPRREPPKRRIESPPQAAAQRELEEEPDAPAERAGPPPEVIIYPAPDQRNVPLWFPGNEIPDPLPHTREKLTGYPITATFPRRWKVENATGKLQLDEGTEVPVWFSSPQKPANKDFVIDQQNTLCMFPRSLLKLETRYRVDMQARVDGKAWKQSWTFTTLSQERLDRQALQPFFRKLNQRRQEVGLDPLTTSADLSRACQAHVRYLTLNLPTHPDLGWNEEDSRLPGYSKEGAEAARQAYISGGTWPEQAVAGIVNSLLAREQLLVPDVAGIGVGYGPYLGGGYLWMAMLKRKAIPPDTREILYPYPDQKEVPLRYPNEEPTPIPKDRRDQPAGYALSAWFPYQTPIREVRAEVVDEEDKKIEGWLSGPESPAMEEFKQQCSICFLPRRPLRPTTTYTATFSARVRGQPWKRTWSFTTWKDDAQGPDTVAAHILADLNRDRKKAGLSPVTLDTNLSHGCLLHARYLSRNAANPATQGLGMHKEVPTLPGATPEGARAGHGVIATIGSPEEALENWMDTFYHRLPLLNPDLERIGFACVRFPDNKWVCVLDSVNGRKKP